MVQVRDALSICIKQCAFSLRNISVINVLHFEKQTLHGFKPVDLINFIIKFF